MINEQLLVEGCGQLNIDVSCKVDKFEKYMNLLIEWNEKINLTAIIEPNEVVTKHFIDSLSVLKFMDLSNKSVIDVGTGAGFPGVPLNIVNPSIKVTLFDSLNKRINFLNEIIGELKLNNISAVHGRAEDFGVNKEYREKFDISISRAVANLSTLSEYCLPFVKVGGYFISMKGPEVDEELKEASKAISVLGGQLERVEKIQLPGTDIIHSIIFIKKIKQCPTNYPRKAGKPSKEPIK
jgi:16S rRNA (guanine527-N7)-methyltransferase